MLETNSLTAELFIGGENCDDNFFINTFGLSSHFYEQLFFYGNGRENGWAFRLILIIQNKSKVLLNYLLHNEILREKTF